MSTGHELLAAIEEANATSVHAAMQNPLVGGYTQPVLTIKTACAILDLEYANLHNDRFDAALCLEYGDVNWSQFPPSEPDRIERFAAFNGYARQELETLVSTGAYPEI